MVLLPYGEWKKFIAKRDAKVARRKAKLLDEALNYPKTKWVEELPKTETRKEVLDRYWLYEDVRELFGTRQSMGKWLSYHENEIKNVEDLIEVRKYYLSLGFGQRAGRTWKRLFIKKFGEK